MQNDIVQVIAGDADETNLYVNTKFSFSEHDTLLGWWNKHSSIFLQLSLMIKPLFGVLASLVISEHVFSLPRRILEKKKKTIIKFGYYR